MTEIPEKRGPIEKGKKGWPINPFGALTLIIFAAIAIFLIGKPLWQRSKPTPNVQVNSTGGRIISPQAGEIVTGNTLTIELSADEPQKAQKIQFWAKTYADGNWQMIGEVQSVPYKLDWQIPTQFQNKAIALTFHILQKDGIIIKDPGGWREGIIILTPQLFFPK